MVATVGAVRGSGTAASGGRCVTDRARQAAASSRRNGRATARTGDAGLIVDAADAGPVQPGGDDTAAPGHTSTPEATTNGPGT